MTTAASPKFFPTPKDFRDWLRARHASVAELWVGYHKKATGRPSITWPQSVDEALCYGWIDGLRKSHTAESYTIRFTPRRATSIWSRINIARVDALTKSGRMRAPGLKAFAARKPARSGIYSFEVGVAVALGAVERRALRANPPAHRFFESQPPGYRRLTSHWVMSAKRAETRERRLRTLIEDSAAGLRIGALRRA